MPGCSFGFVLAGKRTPSLNLLMRYAGAAAARTHARAARARCFGRVTWSQRGNEEVAAPFPRRQIQPAEHRGKLMIQMFLPLAVCGSSGPHTPKVKWVSSGLWYAFCALWISIRVPFPCSGIVSYKAFILLQMTCFLAILASLLAYSQLLLKGSSHLISSVQNCSHDLPGRLEVEFKSRASGNEMLSPAFSCLLTHSFWGCNYSPAMFWSELNYRWTLGPPLSTFFSYLIKRKSFL